MSTSVVEICNMALSNIGSRSSIESLDEASAEGIQCKLWYNKARKQVLAALDWSFARKRLTLALHSEAADLIDWTFRYQFPSDCLQFRKLTNPDGRSADAVPFIIEMNSTGKEKTILTNLDTAQGVYTWDQQDVTVFDPMFEQALAFLIAHYICYTLVGSLPLKKEMLMNYGAMLRYAEATDANQHMDPPPREAEWVRGR